MKADTEKLLQEHVDWAPNVQLLGDRKKAKCLLKIKSDYRDNARNNNGLNTKADWQVQANCKHINCDIREHEIGLTYVKNPELKSR